MQSAVRSRRLRTRPAVERLAASDGSASSPRPPGTARSGVGLQRREDFLGAYTPTVVTGHGGEQDGSVPSDDEGGRGWEFVGVISVVGGDIDAERVEAAGRRLRLREDEAVFASDLVPAIAEHGEPKILCLGEAQGSVRRLRRDGDQRRARGLDVRERLLVGRELKVAVGAPGAAVEDKNDRPRRECGGQLELAAAGVRQEEVWGAIADRWGGEVAKAEGLGVFVEDGSVIRR
jgi:hypothetical protein